MSYPIRMVLLSLLIPFTASTQVSYTAHDHIPAYQNSFHFGINPGAHEGWTDDQLGDISREIGINTFRPTLPEWFLEYWGYDIRLDVFQHYDAVGLKDNTVFIGYPSPEHKEGVQHCPGADSETFANLYEPIWDDGANGTPVNEENYYAIYVYKMAQLYKDYVKFWEIWNEPDFSFTINAVEPVSNPESWWNVNPDPCDHAFRAPITHYVRMLRISYEVIKSVDSTAYICTGGLGYASYLDAILRNTDNPEEGLISDDFPRTGGAYFDVLSFHSYPHIDNSLRYWNNDINGFSYTRHSDAAVDGFVRVKKEFEAVLDKYEYNGQVHPKKLYINTETNLPRRRFAESMGSEAGQRHYLVKTVVACYQEEILQLHPYSLAELETYAKANDPFQMMGMYEKLTKPTEKQVITSSGWAWKTASDFLNDKHVNAELTEAMNLPDNIRGAAFLDNNGNESFALWAVTDQDNSEKATAFYTFPSEFDLEFVEVRHWNFAQTNRPSIIANADIQLTGAPVFLQKATQFPDDYLERVSIFGFPNPFSDQINVELNLIDFTEVTLNLLDVRGVAVDTLIAKQFYGAGTHQFNFPYENLPVGVYFLKLATPKEEKVYKLLKY